MSIMFMKAKLVCENFPAGRAVMVIIRVVCMDVLYMFIAVLAIMVPRALHPVFFQAYPGGEIDVAVVANVMSGRFCDMTIISCPAVEVQIAACTIRHYKRW